MPINRPNKYDDFFGYRPLIDPKINIVTALIMFIFIGSIGIIYSLQLLLFYLYTISVISKYVSYDAVFAWITGIIISCLIWLALFFQAACFAMPTTAHKPSIKKSNSFVRFVINSSLFFIVSTLGLFCLLYESKAVKGDQMHEIVSANNYIVFLLGLPGVSTIILSVTLLIWFYIFVLIALYDSKTTRAMIYYMQHNIWQNHHMGQT